ncbi:cytochrome P450 [Sporodiniella umbellata]|nr:cytochrome P450 [Sporodiniella umbellata]
MHCNLYNSSLEPTKRRESIGSKPIPYPSAISWPILGHFPSMIISPIQMISKWNKETGPIYKLDMGSQQWTIINDPHLAHEIFVVHGDTTWSRPYHYFSTEVHALGNRGLTANTDDLSWKHNRNAVVNALKPESIVRFTSAISYEFQELMRRLETLENKDKAFDPWQHIALAALNITCAIACAKRFSSVTDPGFQATSKLIDENALYFGPVDNVFGLKKKMELFSQKRKCLLGNMINEAITKNDASLVKELYKIKNEEKTLNDDDILVLVDDFISGSETITTMLLWTLAVLSQQTEAQEKVIQELDHWKSLNPSRDFPSFQEDRGSFTYSICVQKEILRLCPPAPLSFPHTCTKDTVVNGYLIPKDTALIANILSINRTHDIYKDPDTFKPERFLKNTKSPEALLDSETKEIDHFSFGWGRRVCPAVYMTDLEYFVFFAHFFSKFTVQPELDAKGNPVKVDPLKCKEYGITMKPFLTKFRIIPRAKK